MCSYEESEQENPHRQGGHLKPEHNALADKESFVVSSTYGNHNAHAVDTQKGISLGHQQSGVTDTEVSYVIHVKPDPTRKATQRNVKIYFMLSDGSSTVLDGAWHQYYNSGKSCEILEKHQ